MAHFHRYHLAAGGSAYLKKALIWLNANQPRVEMLALAPLVVGMPGLEILL